MSAGELRRRLDHGESVVLPPHLRHLIREMDDKDDLEGRPLPPR